MSRSRRRRKRTPLDLIGPIVGMVVAAVIFIPGSRDMIFSALLGLFLAGSIAYLLFQHWRKKSEVSSTQRTVVPRSTVYHDSTPLSSSPTSQEAPRLISSDSDPRPQVTIDPHYHFNSLNETSQKPRLSGPTQLDLDLLRKIEWKRFESVVAVYFRELGKSSRMTRIGPDGGVDVEIFDPATGQISMLVQCKAWNTYKVGIKPVRELFGVMSAAKISSGAFFTTNEFTQEAVTFCRENQLDPVDGKDFMERIRRLLPEAQERLFAEASTGDYTTPTCPSCDVKMVLRTAAKGKSEGTRFWGCHNYPRCKRTFKLV